MTIKLVYFSGGSRLFTGVKSVRIVSGQLFILDADGIQEVSFSQVREISIGN